MKTHFFIIIILILFQFVPKITYAQNPVFYLNANGAIGSNTFTDSGPNNYPVTVNGNPINDSSCGNTAVYINGSSWQPSGHYIFSPANPDFNMGTSDFTIHFWVYLENVTSTHAAFDFRTSAAEHIFFIHYPTTGWLFGDRQGAGTLVAQNTATMQAQQWTHVALVRSGSNFSIYINGCVVATNTSGAAISNSTGLQVGYSWDNRDQLNGYIDEFYIYKGTALWTGGFIPPGCSIFSSCINCNSPISSSVVASNVKCKGDSTGSITVNASGGTAPYTYQWSGYASNQTGATASGLPAGTYTVIVSDQSCYADTHTVVVTEPNTALFAGVSPTDTTLCLEESVTISGLAGGGTPPYSYAWNNGSSNSSQQVSPLASTTYTLTITDTNNCSASDTTTILINIPTAQFTTTDECLSDSVHFTNTSSTNMGNISSYSWNFGDGFSSSSNNPEHLYTAPGTYIVQLTIVTDNGCSDSIQTSVLLYPMPNAQFYATNTCDQNSVLFNDSSYILSPDSVVLWNWNFGDGSPEVNAQLVIGGYIYNLPGVYSTQLTVTSSHGCIDSITKPVTVYHNPIANFNSTTVCKGIITNYADSSTVNGGNINSWVWDFGDNTSISNNPSPTHLYANCGNFSTQLLVVTTNGCKDSITHTTVVHCLPQPNAGMDDTLCYSESAPLSVSPNGAGFSYNWGTVSGPNFSNQHNPVVNPTITTTYIVILTDTNACSAADSVTIFVDSEIELTTLVTNVSCNAACDGQIVISVSGGTSPYTYGWSGTCVTATCNGLCPGTYSITLTDSWGCESTTDTTITEPPPLVAFINTFNQATCSDSCNGNATITAIGGTAGPGYTYLWNTVQAQTTAFADSLCAGTYTCLVTDANLCQSADTVVITAPPALNLVISTTPSACADSTGTATINTFGGTPGYSYIWTPTGQTTQTATGLSASTYTVTVLDVNGCTSSQTAVVNTVNGPIVIASANSNVITSGNTANLTVTGQGSYHWYPAEGLSCDTCQSPIASPSESTTYCVLVKDTNNCSDSSCVTITVEYMCDLTVPNAFSPNNDGHNDVLTLHGWDKCVSAFSILIFNRWGEKVFESNNTEKTWDGGGRTGIGSDGTIPNNNAVFIYYINATLISGEEIIRKGNITLIK